MQAPISGELSERGLDVLQKNTLKTCFSNHHAKSAEGQAEAQLSQTVTRPAQTQNQITISSTSLKQIHGDYTDTISLKRKHARLGNARNVRPKTGPGQADEVGAEPGTQSQKEDLRPGEGGDMPGELGLNSVTSITRDHEGTAQAIFDHHDELHATCQHDLQT